MKIYAFHLLNDFSGSPKVLMQLAKGWVKNGLDVHLVTSSGRHGFLSNIKGITNHYYWYSWAKNPLLRLFNLSLSQILLFIKMIFLVKKQDIIYVNTVLPFGAAILGKFKGCRIIYHLHETTMKPEILKKFLFGIAKWTANDVIYVSKFLSHQEEFKNCRTHIIYNAIEDSFMTKAKLNRQKKENPEKVLMVCSLKDYKGVNEFVVLAESNQNFQFRVVLNAANQEIESYFNMSELPSNLEIFDTQTNLHPCYKWADIILNLSRPDGWIETFGLTIIEGMAYGLPAIVPPVGGITELVQDHENGFQADSRDSKQLNNKLNQIMKSYQLYQLMVNKSIEKINEYSENHFNKQSLKVINLNIPN